MTPEQLDVFVLDFADSVVRGKANVSDLDPTLFPFRLQREDRSRVDSVSVMPLGGLMQWSKDACRVIVHKLLNKVEADGYLFATEGWSSAMLPGEDPATFECLVPSERPNRVSILKVSGRLRTGAGVTYIVDASNLVGERFTKPFDRCEGEETGRFSNFFDEEAADVCADS